MTRRSFWSTRTTEYGAPGPKTLKGSPVFIHLSVKDVDAFAKRAVEAGAKITMPLRTCSGATATASSKIRLVTGGQWRRTSRI